MRHLDGTYDRLELWTSPVAATTAALAPHRVREDLPGPIPPTVGGGALAIWADQAPPHSVFVYDLADGRRRVVEFPLGVANVAPIYVSTNELLVAPVDGRVSGPSRRKLWRIDLTGIPYDGG